MEYKNLDEFLSSAGYTIDGFWYPRVTSIVSIKAKPALYRYYAMMPSFSHAERIKNKSAEEGTLIHEAIQSFLTGKDYPKTEETNAAVKAFVEFSEKTRIEVDPDWIERRIINPDERYSGTVDAVALIDGRLGVLDIKTSKSIYRDYSLQTSAYFQPIKRELPDLSTRWILRVDLNQTCSKCGALRRTKGGKESVRLNYRNAYSRECFHEWAGLKGEIELKEFTDFEADFEAFLGAKRLWEWEHLEYLKSFGYR